MKKTMDENTMVTVKVASKELCIAKGKIKDMIKNNEISFEFVNCMHYIDINEVKEKLNEQLQSKQLLVLDNEMKFILEETLEDFKYSSISSNHKNIIVMKKVLKSGYITDFDDLEYLIGYFSNVLLDGYEQYPNEFIKWFNIKTSSDFYSLRNYYFQINRNLSVYLEYFVMFDKLTNGKIKIIDYTTVKLQMIKNHYFKQSA